MPQKFNSAGWCSKINGLLAHKELRAHDAVMIKVSGAQSFNVRHSGCSKCMTEQTRAHRMLHSCISTQTACYMTTHLTALASRTTTSLRLQQIKCDVFKGTLGSPVYCALVATSACASAAAELRHFVCTPGATVSGGTRCVQGVHCVCARTAPGVQAGWQS